MPHTVNSGSPDPVYSQIVTDRSMVGGTHVFTQLGAPWRVERDNYRYGEYDTAIKNLKLENVTNRAPGDKVNESRMTDITWKTGDLQAKGLSVRIPDEVLDQCMTESLRSLFIEGELMALANELELEAEIAFYNLVNTTGGDIPNASPSTKWGAASGTTIFADIMAAVRNMHLAGGVRPNYGIMPWAVAEAVYNSSEYQERVKYTHGDLVTRPFPYIAPILGINWIVPGARENTSQTSTPSLAHVWDDDHVILFHLPSDAATNPRAKTPVRMFYGGSSDYNLPWTASSWREQNPTYRSQWWAVEWKWDMRLIYPKGAYILNDVLA